METRTAEGPVRRCGPFIAVVVTGLWVLAAACSAPPPVSSSTDALSGDVPDKTKDTGRQKTTSTAPASTDAIGDGGAHAANASNAANAVGGDACTGFAICSMIPASVAAGSVGASGLILNVTGAGFDGASVVVFGGSDVPTKLVTANAITATVPSQLLADVGSRTVSVRGMAGTTAPQMFNVTAGTSGSNGSNAANGVDVVDVVDVDEGCGINAFTCADVGLDIGECGILDDGSSVQCLDDGCVYDDCF